ncbi:unnamed protein product [Enterobius vermicularis]|uniref:BRCA2 n=1 Tax=Enterobius vermicularis TaxID=51028 RepID=A0A0N4VMK2_ENTVE|nr:unnamed protein product [Enterobius vermicularis]
MQCVSDQDWNTVNFYYYTEPGRSSTESVSQSTNQPKDLLPAIDRICYSTDLIDEMKTTVSGKQQFLKSQVLEANIVEQESPGDKSCPNQLPIDKQEKGSEIDDDEVFETTSGKRFGSENDISRAKIQTTVNAITALTKSEIKVNDDVKFMTEGAEKLLNAEMNMKEALQMSKYNTSPTKGTAHRRQSGIFNFLVPRRQSLCVSNPTLISSTVTSIPLQDLPENSPLENLSPCVS